MPTSAPAASSTSPSKAQILPLTPLKPDLRERAWASVPHPTLPLLATAHAKSVTVFSLSSLSAHSTLTGGHSRSVRCVAWKPGLPPHKLCLVTGSFDSTAGLWRWDGDAVGGDGGEEGSGALEQGLEKEVTSAAVQRRGGGRSDDESDDGDNVATAAADQEWEFTLVLEGHDSEIKSSAFSPSGAYLATCSRDKSVWIWEDIGATEADDEWETVAVLNEHEGDVKCVAWCPDVPGRTGRRGAYASDVLASASYDNTVRVWREDADAEWVCVAVLEGHEGTVWGLQWEGRPRAGEKFPRLLSYSADGTVRIWTLKQDDEQDDQNDESSRNGAAVGLSGGIIPNTMRRSLREEWSCTAVLPKAHSRDIYSAAWSAETGLVASTGSDGIVALYAEDATTSPESSTAADSNGDQPMTDAAADVPSWRILETRPAAHGPYEVNHVAWCKRHDAGSHRRGEEEMLVTTGDDGIVRPWQVVVGGGTGEVQSSTST